MGRLFLICFFSFSFFGFIFATKRTKNRQESTIFAFLKKFFSVQDSALSDSFFFFSKLSVFLPFFLSNQKQKKFSSCSRFKTLFSHIFRFFGLFVIEKDQLRPYLESYWNLKIYTPTAPKKEKTRVEQPVSTWFDFETDEKGQFVDTICFRGKDSFIS